MNVLFILKFHNEDNSGLIDGNN